MTNKPETTEKLLANGKKISLSATERDEMRSALLSYAEYHGIKQSAQNKRSWVSFVWARTLMASSLALVLFIGTVYSSTDSLPGEPLYKIKVNIAEEMIAITKITPLSKLEYQHERFETRLSELRLIQEGSMNDNALTELQNELKELVDETAVIVEGQEGIEDSVTLDLIGNIVGVTNDIEGIVRNDVGQEVAEEFEAIVDGMEIIREGEVDDLVSNSTSTIQLYVQSQIENFSNGIPMSNMTAETADRINIQISNAQTSLEEDEYKDAILSIYNAQLVLDEAEDVDEMKMLEKEESVPPHEGSGVESE